MLTIKEVAEKLNLCEYRAEEKHFLESELEKAGIVVAFCASDDLIEFRGAINDESGHGVYIDSNGPIEMCDCNCKYFQEHLGKCELIDVDYKSNAWIITAGIPHETFDVMEDGELYCKGIVFNINNLS